MQSQSAGNLQGGVKGTTLIGQFKRIPSPSTYYQNFNKQSQEMKSYYNPKNFKIQTWKQKFQGLNSFTNEEIFGEKLRERTRKLRKQAQEEEESDDYRKRREKEMFLQTEQLEKMINQHNKEAPQDRQKQLRKIKKNIDMIGFINNKQRKLYSNSKQQTNVINQIRDGQQQEITKESMDRKGLALRIVLSSIPVEKLKQFLEYKNQEIHKVVDNLAQISKETKLNKQVEPKINKLRWEIQQSLDIEFISKTRKEIQSRQIFSQQSAIRKQPYFLQQEDLVLNSAQTEQNEFTDSQSDKNYFFLQQQNSNSPQKNEKENMKIRTQQGTEFFIQNRIFTTKSGQRTKRFLDNNSQQRTKTEPQIGSFINVLKNDDIQQIKQYRNSIVFQDDDIMNFKKHYYTNYLSKNQGMSFKIDKNTEKENQKTQTRVENLISTVEKEQQEYKSISRIKSPK